ncbi:methanogenesis marker 9 domain-containing protein [Methanimicrococcus blatticola]|uniref:TIM-barrel protein n=1 Tax=Methanimicrococcus blatticola TaxID=91560 RepID=A0A484F404_9EURY|nr:methanogenesis marker 9 domain-containing protein [Methanimicrococcus blatticola]MBZ3936018.1 methanogenesis marker 9 domain-containing protein [Methanimicrococcus blatticola]MCC2509369.1 methanogenesis marker 9 domain-containing protein [Methanimicrococcus blatticola]TDQ68252.1 TIM-barrel protein [Methanimicrococcus blatticola]
MENTFDLKIGDITIQNPIVLSAMAGVTDSKFAAANAKNAGIVILGAYNLDEASKTAGSEAAARGRTEFTVGDDVNGDVLIQIENEIDAVKAQMPETVPAISVRSATLEPLLKAAELIKSKNAIMELDIHCRQPEFTERGLGQALLKETQSLAETIQKIKETGVILSVKFRTNVVTPEMAAEFFDVAGADIIHADAMIEGKGADLEAIAEIRNATRKLVIANNSVDDFDAALDFFSSGADMVSVARAAADDPEFIPHLVKKITEYQQETGWYNAPKHVCKRGDNRGLAFCCPPVKYCSLLKKIESVGFTSEEFIQLKQNSVKGTPLEGGKDTCFGSLVWCCKGTKPCYYRDGSLSQLGIAPDEYMRMKKELSEKILNAIDEKKTAGTN